MSHSASLRTSSQWRPLMLARCPAAAGGVLRPMALPPGTVTSPRGSWQARPGRQPWGHSQPEARRPPAGGGSRSRGQPLAAIAPAASLQTRAGPLPTRPGSPQGAAWRLRACRVSDTSS
jgi:hypothetical protein